LADESFALVDAGGGRGGDSALRRTSCSAHCGYKWSTNELLLRLLFQ